MSIIQSLMGMGGTEELVQRFANKTWSVGAGNMGSLGVGHPNMSFSDFTNPDGRTAIGGDTILTCTAVRGGNNITLMAAQRTNSVGAIESGANMNNASEGSTKSRIWTYTVIPGDRRERVGAIGYQVENNGHYVVGMTGVMVGNCAVVETGSFQPVASGGTFFVPERVFTKPGLTLVWGISLMDNVGSLTGPADGGGMLPTSGSGPRVLTWSSSIGFSTPRGNGFCIEVREPGLHTALMFSANREHNVGWAHIEKV